MYGGRSLCASQLSISVCDPLPRPGDCCSLGLQLLLLRYLLTAPPNGQVWHKAFFGGSGRRAVAHTRPIFAKNVNGPVGIPLIRGASGAGRLTQPSRRRSKPGGRPPEAEGKLSNCHDTPGRICAAVNTADQSAT